MENQNQNLIDELNKLQGNSVFEKPINKWTIIDRIADAQMRRLVEGMANAEVNVSSYVDTIFAELCKQGAEYNESRIPLQETHTQSIRK